MSKADIFAAVLAANLLTGAFLYFVLRLKRDEGDMRAIAGAIACCAVAGLAGFVTLN